MYTFAININEEDFERLTTIEASEDILQNLIQSMSIGVLKKIIKEDNGVVDITADTFTDANPKEDKVIRDFFNYLGGVAVMYKAKSSKKHDYEGSH